jgi:hypothetical protein
MPIPVIRGSGGAGSTPHLQVTVSGPDREGKVVIRRQSEIRRTINDTGTEISTRIDWYREIKEGEPDSSRWHGTYAVSYQRDGWEAATATSFELTSTASHFHLTESNTARQGDTVMFERRRVSSIERKLI